MSFEMRKKNFPFPLEFALVGCNIIGLPLQVVDICL